ncbi:MAG: hypothetical protein L0226_15080 [Acidobacteria bacterium]|nr:hypothetical protein [Acidobacteriota bacterium]MCI0665869.1 hypothetical protein [Acidobacteriota bacterium]
MKNVEQGWIPTPVEVLLVKKLNEMIQKGLKFNERFPGEFIPSIYQQMEERVEGELNRLTRKQHNALWRILTEYDLSELEEHRELINTVRGVMETLDALHKGWWGDKEADECKRIIKQTLERLSRQRDNYIERLKKPDLDE